MANFNKQSNKRSRSNSNDGTEPVNFPRFLVIQGSDPNKPLKLSPFAINKGVQSLAGPVKSIKRLRSGDILVEVERAGQASNLLKTDKFVNIPIKVSPHKTLNSCKGVVRCPELRDCDDDEILEELADQQVIDVHRITVNQNGIKKPTNTLFLTFNRSTIPSYIKVGYLRVKVDIYIPNPNRCFKCQKFGHFRSYCQLNECCENCGKDDHTGPSCQVPSKCINCGGSHPANSRSCPKWIEEKRIQELKALGNLSYPEARKLYQTQHTQSCSYADKTKQSTGGTNQQPKVTQQPKATATTQTDITWLNGDFPVTLENNKATNTEKPKSQTEKQDQQKKGQTKTKDRRRSRSLSRDPPTRNTSSNQETKKPSTKVKSKLQINVSKSLDFRFV
nr:uncharacterized protein LOC129254320 [Lytechinus pictus]XP_054748747.1 uncharacterized protein LOC129254320 [Lytechinus pictus]